ncbi:MAG: hypothetical protein NVS2B7_32550 [Herpetosiphon sp.]
MSQAVYQTREAAPYESNGPHLVASQSPSTPSATTITVVACTMQPSCVDATNLLLERAAELATNLERQVPVKEAHHIHIVGCEHGAALPQNADILLRTLPDKSVIAAYGHLPAPEATSGLPWPDLLSRITRLLKFYKVDRCARDDFHTWAAKQPAAQLQKMLGMPF